MSVLDLFADVSRCSGPEREGRKVASFLGSFHLLPFDWDAAIRKEVQPTTAWHNMPFELAPSRPMSFRQSSFYKALATNQPQADETPPTATSFSALAANWLPTE